MRIPEFLIIALVAPKKKKKSKQTSPKRTVGAGCGLSRVPNPRPSPVRGDDEDDNDNDNVDAAKMTRQGCRCNERTNERASEPTVAATATQGNAVMGSRCVCVVMPHSLPCLPHSPCCWLSLRFCCHCHRRLLLLVGEINYVANAKCSALCRQGADWQQQRVQRERGGKTIQTHCVWLLSRLLVGICRVVVVVVVVASSWIATGLWLRLRLQLRLRVRHRLEVGSRRRPY